MSAIVTIITFECMRLLSQPVFYRRGAFCFLEFGESLWEMCGGQSFGIRDRDEVVVMVVIEIVPTQVEIMAEGLVMETDGIQAKYMVRRVSWWIWTALARAWGSRPLLWPDTWLPSPLQRQQRPVLLNSDTSYLRTAISSLSQSSTAWHHCLRLSKRDKASVTIAMNSQAINKQTCHVLCPQDGSEHERPQDEHSRLAQGWRLNEYNAHMCGTTGRLGSAARPPWNDCHPIKHSNEKVGWFPEKGDWKNKKKKSNHQLCSKNCRICRGFFLVEIH